MGGEGARPAKGAMIEVVSRCAREYPGILHQWSAHHRDQASPLEASAFGGGTYPKLMSMMATMPIEVDDGHLDSSRTECIGTCGTAGVWWVELIFMHMVNHGLQNRFNQSEDRFVRWSVRCEWLVVMRAE